MIFFFSFVQQCPGYTCTVQDNKVEKKDRQITRKAQNNKKMGLA